MAWLTQAQARDQADLFRHHIAKYGVPVSVELQRGSGGGQWGQDTFRVNMAHHIASYRHQGLTPGLNLIKNGRGGPSPLPPPLANGYGGFDMVARIISMGLANHPGQGGPFTVDGVTIPRNQGRVYAFGWEFEGGYLDSDWPADFREFMAICNRGAIDAIRELRGGGVTYDAHLEHSTWAPGRKSDRRGYTRAQAVAEIKAITSITQPEEDFDMPRIVKAPDRAEHYITDGITKRWIKADYELADLNRVFGPTQLVGWNTLQLIPTVQQAVWTDRKVRRGGKDIDAIQDLADTGSIAREIRDLLKEA